MNNELKGEVGELGQSSGENVLSPGGEGAGGTCVFEELKGSQCGWRAPSRECDAGRSAMGLDGP